MAEEGARRKEEAQREAKRGVEGARGDPALRGWGWGGLLGWGEEEESSQRGMEKSTFPERSAADSHHLEGVRALHMLVRG